MPSKYFGIHESQARLALLEFLNLMLFCSKKRFSRNMLIKQLGVPNSIAREFSEGMGNNPHATYKSLSDADPREVEAIRYLVDAINEARRVDEFVGSLRIESVIHRDRRTNANKI